MANIKSAKKRIKKIDSFCEEHQKKIKCAINGIYSFWSALTFVYVLFFVFHSAPWGSRFSGYDSDFFYSNPQKSTIHLMSVILMLYILGIIRKKVLYKLECICIIKNK